MPAFKQAPQTASETASEGSETTSQAKVDPNAVSEDKSDTDQAGEADAGTSSKAVKTDETPPAIKREITLERNRRRAAEQEAATAKAELSKALEALANVTKTPAKATEDARPARADFADPDAYEDALIDWSSRRASAKARADEAEQRVKDARFSEFEAQKKLFLDRKTAFMKNNPDYEDIAESDDVEISGAMTSAILASEDGPAIAYYLGQNPDDAARIAKLSPMQAAKEIGKIEARLGADAKDAADAKPFKRKPAPMTPVGTRSTASRRDPSEESMEEYAARRTPEILASRRPFIQRS
jgi:hypothetical protein